MSAIVQKCTGCQTLLFPYRLLCPACGGNQFGETQLDVGVVEQFTTLADGTVLATVQPDGGPTLIARLTGPANRGQAMTLTNDPHAGSGHAFVPAGTTSTVAPHQEDK